MKRNFLIGLLFITFVGADLKVQAQDINFGDFYRPVPSVSSLPTYVNTPISIASGNPEISIPITKISTVDKNFEMGVALSYHAGNVRKEEAAGEVGSGWSLFKGGVISREIEGEIDEFYDNASASNYKKNEFDDFYYYSFPGASGKFQIKRNVSANTFSIEHLSSNNIKIDYTRENNTATLLLSSFTLTDERGYKYYFNDYSISTVSLSNYEDNARKQYKSAFFLSKITDANNVELTSFTYQKDSRNIRNTNTFSYRTCKLKTIISKDIGQIAIDYRYDESVGAMNDLYSVSAIFLRDRNGSQIEKYTFDYGYYSYQYQNKEYSKRVLSQINKTNRNSTVIEKTTFQYDISGSITDYRPNKSFPFGNYLCLLGAAKDPRNRTNGLLKSITYPSKARVEYNYESNQIAKDKNNQNYYTNTNEKDLTDPETQYMKRAFTTEYDTYQGRDYPLQVTTSKPGIYKKVYISFGVDEVYTQGPNGQDPITGTDNELFVNYYLIINGHRVDPNVCNSISGIQTIELPAGNYTLRVVGTGGRGAFSIFEVITLSPPYKNISTIEASGVRIKNIVTHENPIYMNNKKTIEYEYDDFSNPLNTSGSSFYEGVNPGFSTHFMLYKNVKVKEGDNGYTKYYFKLPNEYTGTAGFVPYYNLTKKGVLEKIETYNSANQLLSSKTLDYTFENIINAPEYQIRSQTKSKPSWIKRDKVTERLFEAGTQRFVENSTESWYNVSNYQLSSSRRETPDANMETFVRYAIDKNKSSLLNANMLNVPLEVENKYNGKITSKSETRYDGTHLRPTSVVSYGLQNTASTIMTYDRYDSKGNLQQYTMKDGTPVAIVWGYNQTQPIAQVEGATYAQVANQVSAIINASNADAADPSKEPELITALDNFRKNSSLSAYQITTYTYDALVGVTNITPPSGIRESYLYDSANRLEKIIDVNGTLVKEFKYNNKN